MVDKVSFLGFVADPFEVYYAADGALICSEHEALSRVGLEGMSTALPLIGKNSGGNPEIIEDGVSGVLYDDFEGLVAAMQCMAQDPGWARQLGHAGWLLAREKFTIEDNAAQIYEIIQSLIQRSP